MGDGWRVHAHTQTHRNPTETGNDRFALTKAYFILYMSFKCHLNCTYCRQTFFWMFIAWRRTVRHANETRLPSSIWTLTIANDLQIVCRLSYMLFVIPIRFVSFQFSFSFCSMNFSPQFCCYCCCRYWSKWNMYKFLFLSA